MLTYAQGALAQSAVPRQVWIQLETRLHLEDSMDSIENYARDLSNVNGFEINGGWFGVAIGPYDPEQADADLQKLRAQGIIPRTSFTTSWRNLWRALLPARFGGSTGHSKPYGPKHGTPNRAAPCTLQKRLRQNRRSVPPSSSPKPKPQNRR